MPTFTSDVIINEPYPGVVFSGTETTPAAAQPWTEREIAGVLWLLQNADWSTTQFVQTTSTQPSYGISFSNGQQIFYIKAAGASPWTTWDNPRSAPLQRFFNPVDYGADPTGSADCTTAVNKMFTDASAAASASSGVHIFWPRGTYKTSGFATVTFPAGSFVTIEGHSTTILCTSATADVFSFAGTGSGVSYWAIGPGFTFTFSSTRTAGYCIVVDAHTAVGGFMKILGPTYAIAPFGGLKIAGGATSLFVDQLSVSQMVAGGKGVYVTGGAAGPVISNCSFNGPKDLNSHGVLLDPAVAYNTLKVHDNIFTQLGFGILHAQNASGASGDGDIYNNTFDGMADTAIVLAPNTGASLQQLSIRGNHFACGPSGGGSFNNSIHISGAGGGAIQTVLIEGGNRFLSASASHVVIGNASDVTIVNNYIKNANLANSGGFGIDLASVPGARICGNQIGESFGGETTQYAIHSLGSSNVDVLGNVIRSMTNGAIIYDTAVGWKIRGNSGANPGGPQATVVFTSGVAKANPYPYDLDVSISGGAVSAVAIDGQTTGLTAGTFMWPAGATMTVTFTAAPTVVVYAL